MNPLAQLFIGAHARVYRLTGGRLGGTIGTQQVVLLTTTGRKTGKRRTVPVGSFEDGGDRLVVASAAGAPSHPAWFNNLAANPEVTVQAGSDVYQARAEVTSGDERARLWKMIVEKAPTFGEYQKKAGSREIPVVRLKRQERG
jgi:deazaflavin-dependent oxidoreductase (nitroreductase family)